MTVTIKLNTLLTGATSYFAGMSAERHSLPSYAYPGLGLLNLVRMDRHPIHQNGLVATLNFDQVPAGEHYFCVRAADGLPRWRSPRLRIATGDEQFSFHVLAVDVAETTFKPDQLTAGLSIPKTFDIDGLDEDLTISSLDLAILSDHLDVDGEGEISKDNDWSILQSDVRFDYDFTLEPANSVTPDRFFSVVKRGEISLQISNPLTSIGTFFMREKVEGMIRRSIKNAADKAIQDQLQNQASRLSRSQRSQVTATVGSIKIVQQGTPSIRVLQLVVDVSFPSSAVSP